MSTFEFIAVLLSIIFGLAIANLLSATIDAFDQVDILVNGARQVTVSDPLSPDVATEVLIMKKPLEPAGDLLVGHGAAELPFR